MSAFWRIWFIAFCLSLLIFGAVLAGGAIDATSGPARLLLGILGGTGDVVLEPALRFSLAVLGAVSIGWAVMMHFVIAAAIRAGKDGRPLWNAITAGLVSWFVIDSILSVTTGFGLNVIPNVLLAGMYFIGLYGSGVTRA